MKKRLCIRLAQIIGACLIMLNACPVTVLAETDSYIYSVWEKAEAAPAAYELERSVRARDLGVESLNGITDLFVRDDHVYLAVRNAVIICDSDFNLLRTITHYEVDGASKPIGTPGGIYCTKDFNLYVTLPESGVILHFNPDYTLNRILGEPEITGLETVKYQPVNVIVDDVGRIYVLAKNIYEGIIELNPEGHYNRFFGANEVKVSPADIIWRSIATDSQLANMSLRLPTDYSDIAIDKDGFIFAAVRSSSSTDMVRKLNSKGADIMPEYDDVTRPSGDISSAGVISNISSVACAGDGRFAMLDTTNMRVFVYDEKARMLYLFGGVGTTEGRFRNANALGFMGEKILVTDSVTQSIEVFAPTEYGMDINLAVRYQSEYKYDDASVFWDKAVKISPSFDYAYSGIGRKAIRSEEYDLAAAAFKNSGDVDYYSIAFSDIRMRYLENNFMTMLAVVMVFVIAFVGLRTWKWVRGRRKGGA